MITTALPAADLGLSAIANAISSLYKITCDLNDWVDKHIQEMQQSDNITISRTGKVLQGAKFGFGLGYLAPITIIATGQFLLGNPLSAASTVTSAITLSNPIAMTCAAVGAIYYGWLALTDDERADALDKLSNGLEIGIELIKAVIRYVSESVSNLISSKHVTEFKAFINEGASKFGKSLYEVTQDIPDKLNQIWHGASDSVSEALVKSKETIKESGEYALKSALQIKSSAANAIEEATSLIKNKKQNRFKKNN